MLVKLATVCRCEKAEIVQGGEDEATELTRVEEREDRMSDEEGDGVGGEGELAPPDWRVRAGPQNRPTQKEREDREASHVPFRDWPTHYMMGRGRTHHVTKQKSEDQSRRRTLAMEINLVGIGQTMSEESVTCIAVKEDSHQNIMNSVAWKNGVEEPWTTNWIHGLVRI